MCENFAQSVLGFVVNVEVIDFISLKWVTVQDVLSLLFHIALRFVTVNFCLILKTKTILSPQSLWGKKPRAKSKMPVFGKCLVLLCLE